MRQIDSETTRESYTCENSQRNGQTDRETVLADGQTERGTVSVDGQTERETVPADGQIERGTVSADGQTDRHGSADGQIDRGKVAAASLLCSLLERQVMCLGWTGDP